jgi:hypothetical protein
MFMFTDGYTYQNNFTLATSHDGGSTWDADFVIRQDGNVGIGVTSPDDKLEVSEGSSEGGGYTAITGDCWGSNNAGAYYGVYGYAHEVGGMGVGHFVGVYGSRTGGATGYGVYYSGGMSGTSKAGLIVRTDNGPKEVCFHQATESWLEDFGSGQIWGGRAQVQLAGDFRQTVTVSDTHPLKVFITPNADIGRWWVEKGSAGFVLMAPEAPEGARFDYRVVAKRRGYEDLRLEAAPAAYADHFLYPRVDDVPLEYREAWWKMLPAEEQTN